MSAHCVDCGSPLPDSQGSRTCSMCYGDPGHGKDGYYQNWLDEQRREDEERDRQMREAAEVPWCLNKGVIVKLDPWVPEGVVYVLAEGVVPPLPRKDGEPDKAYRLRQLAHLVEHGAVVVAKNLRADP